MKRFEFDQHGDPVEYPGGEWIRYADHCEAMKRIVGGGVDAAAFIERKAEDYAREFGTNDMGSLSFGNEDMRIYHWHLVELADEIRALAAPSASAQQAEPVAYVNADELDNMLDDRTATIAGVRDGWRGKPLYTAPPSASPTNEAGRLRAALYAIANTYDDHELRQKAREAYDEPAQSGYRCADCKAPLRAGYTCDVCNSDAAEEIESAPSASPAPTDTQIVEIGAEALGMPPAEFAAKIRALFPAASPADQGGWQPIETAPKNQSVLVFMLGQQYVAYYQDDNSDPWFEPGSAESDFNNLWTVTDNKHGPYALRGGRPTHWMPLPPDPAMSATPPAGEPD